MEHRDQIIEGRHYRSGIPVRLDIRKGMIAGLQEIPKASLPDAFSGDKLPLLAPGLVDLQINGFRGIDFNDPDLNPDAIEAAAKAILNKGVSNFYPTLITGSKEKTATLVQTFAKAISQKGLASQMIGGLHLEGPFISSEDGPRGAHPRAHCLQPDLKLLQEWQELAGGNIRILTLAPELPGSEDLIRAAVDMDMVVGIGHTAASGEDIARAADAGATLSTHLGNGSHRLLPRHPNYIWDQLAEDRLYASMIADGFHLPDSVLRVFSRSKGDKALLISDGMPYTGLAPGNYDSPAAGRVCLTPEGKLHLDGQPETLAGSASTLLDGINKMAGLEGFPFAWDMASVHPYKLLNKGAPYGIVEGAPADLVTLATDSDQPDILQVYKKGEARD